MVTDAPIIIENNRTLEPVRASWNILTTMSIGTDDTQVTMREIIH